MWKYTVIIKGLMCCSFIYLLESRDSVYALLSNFQSPVLMYLLFILQSPDTQSPHNKCLLKWLEFIAAGTFYIEKLKRKQFDMNDKNALPVSKEFVEVSKIWSLSA